MKALPVYKANNELEFTLNKGKVNLSHFPCKQWTGLIQ